MKAITLLLVSFFVLCVSTTNVVASDRFDKKHESYKKHKSDKKHESDRKKIRRAMRAAPGSISHYATIRDVDADWTILREGSDGGKWTCFPGVPVNEGDKHPMCNDEVWMDWLWAVKSLLEGGGWDFETESVGFSYMLRGDALVNNDNPLPNPGDPGVWDQEGPHIMLLFPTEAEIAHLPRDPNYGGPYVMWGDWPLIHVMVPLTDR